LVILKDFKNLDGSGSLLHYLSSLIAASSLPEVLQLPSLYLPLLSKMKQMDLSVLKKCIQDLEDTMNTIQVGPSYSSSSQPCNTTETCPFLETNLADFMKPIKPWIDTNRPCLEALKAKYEHLMVFWESIKIYYGYSKEDDFSLEQFINVWYVFFNQLVEINSVIK
jgi:Formin Homology 2 Domain